MDKPNPFEIAAGKTPKAPPPALSRWAGAIGQCTECHEFTSVLSPCCNAGVEFEGSIVHWDTIAAEACTCPAGKEGHCEACVFIRDEG